MRINLPEPRRLVQAEQYRLLGKINNPDDAQLVRRAQMAASLDKFVEARRDLETIHPDRRAVATRLLLAQVCRELDDYDAGLAALGNLDPSVLPQNLSEHLRLEHAALMRKLGRNDEAIALLESVLDENPRNIPVQRKLAAILLTRGETERALELAERLIAAGSPSPRVLGTAAVALASLGRFDEAEEMRGFERFFTQSTLPGHRDLNARVIAELRAHPALRFGNSQQASEGSWRIDELMVRKQPALTQLLEAIVDQASLYVGELGGPPHPWLEAQPPAAQMKAWAIIAPADGVETWHTHDQGWLSGVYYLAVPGDLPCGNDKAGAIEFGWTDRLLDDATRAQLPYRAIHPAPGMLLLFPSHIHHRTWPHGTNADRICIAFDIQPTS